MIRCYQTDQGPSPEVLRLLSSFSAEAYEQLRQLLSGAGLGLSPSELQGMICGMLAGDAQPRLDTWSAELLAESPDPAGLAPVRQIIEQLQARMVEQIDGQDLSLELLLPADAPAAARARALGEWCQGFLYGYGRSGRTSTAELSTEAREVLHDFEQIARVDTDEVRAGEADERALMELEEYVRMATLLIRTETAGGGSPPERPQ